MRDGDGRLHECVSDNPVWFSDEIAGCERKRQDDDPENRRDYVDRRIGTDWRRRTAHAALVAKRESFAEADETMRDDDRVPQQRSRGACKRRILGWRARGRICSATRRRTTCSCSREMFFSPGGHFGEARSSLRWSKAEAAKHAGRAHREHFGRPPPVQDRAAVDHWEEIKGMDEKVVFATWSSMSNRPGPAAYPWRRWIGLKPALKLEKRDAPKPTSGAPMAAERRRKEAQHYAPPNRRGRLSQRSPGLSALPGVAGTSPAEPRRTPYCGNELRERPAADLADDREVERRPVELEAGGIDVVDDVSGGRRPGPPTPEHHEDAEHGRAAVVDLDPAPAACEENAQEAALASGDRRVDGVF